MIFFFFQAEDGIRDVAVTGVQTCALPISSGADGDGLTREFLEADRDELRDARFLHGDAVQDLRHLHGALVMGNQRSEEHTSELQSRLHLVCRLLLEKKKKNLSNT